MKGLYLFIASFICSASLCAQLDSIQYLNEVVLVDSKLEDFSEGYTLTKISDTLISRNPVSLSDLLNFNSSIDFKTSKKTTLTAGLEISNLLNTSYRNYLSRLRLYADDLGRNYLLTLKLNY